MPFIDIKTVRPIEPAPGCHMRTPFGENLMLSYLEMDAGAVVPMHSHPHEQGGMLLKGRLELTIGDETRVCEPGSMFLIPPNTPHKAVAVGGPAVVLDVFSPVREDYAKLFNKYIPCLLASAHHQDGHYCIVVVHTSMHPLPPQSPLVVPLISAKSPGRLPRHLSSESISPD